MERRRAIRVQANTATLVSFVGKDQKFTAPLYEFSPFGLSVKTSSEVSAGTVLRLGIQVGVDYFRAAAITRRKDHSVLAVEFLSMTAMDREMMRRLYLRLQMAARAVGDAAPTPPR